MRGRLVLRLMGGLVLAAFLALTVPVLAHMGGGPPEADEPIDCGVWAVNPHHSPGGSYVYSNSFVSCDSIHAQIRVVAELVDDHGRLNRTERTCYGTSGCYAPQNKLTYIGNRYYTARVSGYVGSWNAYYQTDPIYIP